ncbi:MAG: hypothetical protein DME24_05380 [Verrucomicrobia bacterium]|nr:MAG: hypothetical protein DME24_05380 [Verrucomicrobiota bacterium]
MNKRTSNIQHRTLNIEGVEALGCERKLQIPKKLQVPSSNIAVARRRLGFAAWDFFGAWGLGFGNLACDRHGTTDHGQPTTDNEQ